jgi:hypothetical protein
LPIPCLTRTEIQSAIHSLKPKKSPGYDLLTSKTLQERNPGTFPVESPTSDRGRPMVCAEYYYPTLSPHANGQGRNLHLQLSLQPPPQCTP